MTVVRLYPRLEAMVVNSAWILWRSARACGWDGRFGMCCTLNPEFVFSFLSLLLLLLLVLVVAEAEEEVTCP